MRPIRFRSRCLAALAGAAAVLSARPAALGWLSMSEVTIRRAAAADAAALAALRRETAREVDGERSDPGFEDRFAAWLERESPRRIIWLAEAGGGLVGAMNLTVFERMPRPGRAPARWGYLGNAFVLAAYRNRGIGTQLLAALLGHAREQGFVRVVLSPTERSIPFYQRAGFGPAGELMVWHPPPAAASG
jgi:GNAT superfamily N-acetyltransferase